jgi:C4-dicarboxylate transporter DctM subunit
MGTELLALIIFVSMFGLLALGLPIGFALGLMGLLGTSLLIDVNAALALLGSTVFETALNYSLSVVPMFVLMGYFASGAGLSEALYKSCNTWLGHRRGGLALATIGGCGAFAAICGSSLATAATMSQVAMPEMRRYNYDDRLATGAVAAGGTIGSLIPPSVLMVLYGILTETSIPNLFLAGIAPGVLMVLLFMVAIAVITRIDPTLGPAGERRSLRDKILAIKDVWGVVVLFVAVIGGIYTGIFSPTEAAGIGAVGACLLAILNGTFSKSLVVDSLMETTKTTAMIFTILIGAILFNNFLVIASVPDLISGWIEGLPLGRIAILVVILLLYLLLGCVMDSLAMVLLTIPIFFPIIENLGFDPVWFGIIVVIVVELGLITPPIGINVFVIKGMVPDVPLEKIFIGVLPFVIAQVLLLATLVAIPDIALWLPSTIQ